MENKSSRKKIFDLHNEFALATQYLFIWLAMPMETTHKYKDDRVILRFDENEKDWRKN